MPTSEAEGVRDHRIDGLDLYLHVTSTSGQSAYGAVLVRTDTTDGSQKRVLTGSGEYGRERARLVGLREGLAVCHEAASRVDVYLPGRRLANRMRRGLPYAWGESDWRYKSGRPVSHTDMWDWILVYDTALDITWHAGSTGEMMDWARRAALAELVGLSVKDLRPLEEIEGLGGAVSPEKAAHVWMAAKASGYEDIAVRRMLAEMGVVSAKDLPRRFYRQAMERAESPALARRYNTLRGPIPQEQGGAASWHPESGR